MPQQKRTQNIKNTRKTNQRAASLNPVVAYVQNMYNRSAPLLICEAALMALAAMLIVFRMMTILDMLTFIVGAALILFGLYRTISGFIVSRVPGGGWIDVIFGLVNIMLGVLFCAYPIDSFMGIMYVFIVLLLFKAVKALIFAINMARARVGHYAMDLTVAISLFLLVLFLLFFPMAGVITMMYVLAIILLMYAASDIYMFIELVHLKNRVLK